MENTFVQIKLELLFFLNKLDQDDAIRSFELLFFFMAAMSSRGSCFYVLQYHKPSIMANVLLLLLQFFLS